MGLIFGIIKRLIRIVAYFGVFAAIVVLLPNLPPYTKFTSIKLEPTQESVGPLQPNGALNNVEKLYKGKLLGPEAFELHKGEVYTSLQTGEIVKITPGGHVTFVAKIGTPCTGLTQGHKCGRPLGIQIDGKNNLMYVADAYHGIWKVDLNNHKKQLLVSPRVEIEGRKPRLFNGVAVANNGDVYWTDSTSDFYLHDGAYSLMADPSGRLFHYVAAKNQSKVLLDDLWFANGVVLSPDNQFAVVAETGRHRLVKYYIDGPKKGKSEVFASGLPGTPDNLRVLPDGSGLLASLYTTFDEKNPLITHSLAETPVVRKFLARLQRLIEIPFEFLNEHFPNIVFEEIVHHIGHFQSVTSLAPGTSGVLQIDWNGNIVASYYNNDGTLKAISDVIVFNDKLLTGAPHSQDFIGAVPAPTLLKKAFSSVKTTPPPKTAETVTKEVPKPKIETQKPVAKPATETPKVEEKKEAPKPKVEEKKEAPKPKVEEKKEAPKPKVEEKKEAPKPKVEEKKEAPKPNVVEKKEAPKPKVEEKKEAPKPNVVEKKEAPKPAETVKPVEKPSEPKPSTPTPTPKPAEPKPTPTPAAANTKKPEEKPKPTTPAPKVEPKSPPTPKVEPKAEAKKEATPKPAGEKNPPETIKQEKKIVEEREIPIIEEIPSDTIKPHKETIKVIKKTGPTEIPNLG